MNDYTIIILLTLFGFLALAALLLVPVYRFLRREEQASRAWTRDVLALRRSKERANGDGQARGTLGNDSAAESGSSPSRRDLK